MWLRLSWQDDSMGAHIVPPSSVRKVVLYTALTASSNACQHKRTFRSLLYQPWRSPLQLSILFGDARCSKEELAIVWTDARTAIQTDLNNHHAGRNSLCKLGHRVSTKCRRDSSRTSFVLDGLFTSTGNVEGA